MEETFPPSSSWRLLCNAVMRLIRRSEEDFDMERWYFGSLLFWFVGVAVGWYFWAKIKLRANSIGVPVVIVPPERS
jgi:hypothetical protein